ncbi:MAG: hypothetical protein ACRCZZ_00740 [Phocaeicola sp.]
MRAFTLVIPFIALLCSCQPQTTAQKLTQKAEKENKKYPQSLTTNIRIDSVKYNEEANKLTYYYCLSEDLDNQELIIANHSLLQMQLEEAVESEPALLPYLKFGSTISYCYFSQSTRKKMDEFTVVVAK